MELTKDNIEQLIAERKQTYRIADNVVSAFESENSLTRDYNGRQILEMIQNADDAGASYLEFRIDTISRSDSALPADGTCKHDSACNPDSVHRSGHTRGTLTVYNNGKPFNYEGIKSILIPHTSSKVTSQYIGNKGLGFRSLICWTQRISITTEGFRFSFSRQLAEEAAQELGVDLAAIRRQRNLSEACCPFPILGIPHVDILDEPLATGCRIEVKYQEEIEDDILRQLRLIDENCLLFLRNIQHIRILWCGTLVDGGEGTMRDLRVTRTESAEATKADGVYRKEVKTSAGMSWQLVETSHELPSEYQDPNKAEKKSYSIQLAVPVHREQAADAYFLFNYLPTTEQVGLPFILHSTLELDSSRNHVANLPVNRFILEEAAGFISSQVDSWLARDTTCSWQWYEMMTPYREKSNVSSLVEQALFSRLQAERDQKTLFPTVGGEYVGIEDYYYTEPEDSVFWRDFPFLEGNLCRILVPFGEKVRVQTRRMSDTGWVQALNAVSRRADLSIDLRARLINRVVRSVSLQWTLSPSLFADDANQWIDESESTAVFTPKTEGVEYPCPPFVKIRFVGRALYQQVMELLKDYVPLQHPDSDSSQARNFCALLKGRNLARLSDYDKSAVVKAIVSQTNRHVDEQQDPQQQVEAIRQMFRCLAQIYSTTGFDTRLENVRLLNSDEHLQEASSLMLDTPDNRFIFGQQVSYLLPLSQWGGDLQELADDDLRFRKFVQLLGVNLLTESAAVSGSDFSAYASWLDRLHVFDHEYKTVYTRENFNKAMRGESFVQWSKKLSNVLSLLSLPRIIYLLAVYPELMTHAQETLKFQYKQIFYKETPHSYLRHQFLSNPQVANQVLSEDIVLQDIDAEPRILALAPEKKQVVLQFLTTPLRATSEAHLAELLNRLATDTGGRKPVKPIRRIYKLVLEALYKDNRSLKGQPLQLGAYADNGSLAFFPVAQVYYSDNLSLPKALEVKLQRNRLYYPSRQGAKQVCHALGIAPLSEIRLQVQPDTIRPHFLQEACTRLLDDIKPYLLLYCTLHAGQAETKRDLATRLRSLRIQLVTACSYQMGDSAPTALGPKEFIQSGSDFYLNAADVDSLEAMQSQVAYCKRIGEILSIHTQLAGKDDLFVRLFQSPDFMKEMARNDYPYEIEEAQALMGISPKESRFWAELLGVDHIDKHRLESVWLQAVERFQLPADFSFDRVDYDRWLTKESSILLAHVWHTNHRLPPGVDLTDLHQQEFGDVKNSHRALFIHSIWQASCQDTALQKRFIRHQQAYDHDLSFQGDPHRWYTPSDYIDWLKTEVRERYEVDMADSFEPHHPLYPHHDLLTVLPIEEQSLFYFPGNEAKVAEILRVATEKAKTEAAEEEAKTRTGASSAGDEAPGGQIVFLTSDAVEKGTVPPFKPGSITPGVCNVYPRDSDRKKRKSGESAERLVRRLLEAEGLEYQWLSGFSDESCKYDNLGYDFRYKKKGESEWRCLEVKRFSNESFLITRHEYEVAHREANNDRYDLALVKDEKVYIIENFFQSNCYQKVADSYAIYCKLHLP